MSACLVLVRHGQSSFDTDDYDRLSEHGALQAHALATWWARHRPRPRRILSGPMRRQRDTAALLARLLEVAGVQEVPALAEFDHAAIFYAQRPELRDPGALAAWKQGAPDYPARFAQTWRQALLRWQDPAHGADYAEPWPAFHARCLAALELTLAALQSRETSLAVTSSGVLAVAVQAWSRHAVPPFETLQGAFTNTGLTELLRPAASARTVRLGEVDATPHLRPELQTWR